jgi:hypothetical protein
MRVLQSQEGSRHQHDAEELISRNVCPSTLQTTQINSGNANQVAGLAALRPDWNC